MATTPVVEPGRLTPADGNLPQRQLADATGSAAQHTEYTPEQLGPNNEKLEELDSKLVSQLRMLILEYRQEGIVARRHEIRRIRQARLFWQGLHYAWWNPTEQSWVVPFEARETDDEALEDGPRYQYVTNLWQAFGLAFIALMSQELPATVFFPQSAQNVADVGTAKAASDVAELVAQNHEKDNVLDWISFYFWCDGKIGGYVRYVADGPRFGWRQMPEYKATVTEGPNGEQLPGLSSSVRKVPNGQEVISIIDGLQLSTPCWARDQHEFPFLQWQMEVHRAKLKAAYPHVADKIQTGGPIEQDDVYARATRVALSQGMPTTQPGDALYELVTFSRTWIRPWSFYAVEDKDVRARLLKLFPDGAYVAFAGETYCESRSENMDDYWRVGHALPGDGQNRPAVGSSLIDLQERYNNLANIEMETAEYGIPPIYADPQVLDFDALGDQTSEPGVHYPARARPGMSLSEGFFQPQAAVMSPDAIQHMSDLFGPIAQFLTGLLPAIYGGSVPDQKTAAGYAMAREQALGRVGLVWRRIRQFWSEMMLLSVDCFRKNRPDDVEIPQLGDSGQFESKWIRLADLRGNIQAHPEGDETFPRLKSQQRSVLESLLGSPNPAIQATIQEQVNAGYIKSTLGLSDLVIPGEDSVNKQLREIQQLLQTPPSDLGPGPDGQPQMASTIPVDPLLDDHAAEFDACKTWANSEAGTIARAQNPAGFANVRAHAAEHQKALQTPGAQQKPPNESINYKDLPPAGKAQMAGQAGIQLDAMQLELADVAEKAAKAHEQQAKVASLNNRGALPNASNS